MTSKYLGKTYGSYKVVNYFLKDKHKKAYNSSKSPKEHRAYSYVLLDENSSESLVISGNQLRLLESGKRTINQMLQIGRGGYKNKQIGYIKKSKN